MLLADRHLIIQNTIVAFYKKATIDILIGYHFTKIQDWPTHVNKTAAFWFERLNTSGSEQPLKKRNESGRNLIYQHAKLQIRPGQLGRWIVLFDQTLNEQLISPEIQALKTQWHKEIQQFQRMFLANKFLWEHQN